MSWLVWISRLWKEHGATAGPAVASPIAANEYAGVGAGPAEALFEAGRAAFHGSDYDAAMQYFNRVLEISHDHAKAHYYLGLVHLNQSHHEDAADCFLMATHFRPDFPEAIYNLGLDARRRQDYSRAAECFEQAVKLKPDFAYAHNNLGYTLFTDLERYDRGAHHIETAMRLHPEDPSILCNYSAVLLHRGQLTEALTLCDRLLASNPELHEARLNRALAALKRGQFAEAWSDYEARKLVCGNYVPRDFGFPEWNGEPLAGKAILVYAEQGLGDQIMFVSCLPDLLPLVRHCVVECAPKLERLFRRSFPTAAVYASDQTKPESELIARFGAIDYQVAIGSLPRQFRTEASRFAVHPGYLHADPARVAYWRQRLSILGAGPTIGISWRGGAASTRRELRSTSLAEWLPLLRQQGYRFVSLQYGDVSAELAALAHDHAIDIFHPQEAIDDYDETAALVCALDLVISVQTAVAHLGGALGHPTWVLVPAIPEWRYLQDSATMPWYPAVLLFRQQQAGDWGPVMRQVAGELQRFTPPS